MAAWIRVVALEMMKHQVKELKYMFVSCQLTVLPNVHIKYVWRTGNYITTSKTKILMDILKVIWHMNPLMS